MNKKELNNNKIKAKLESLNIPPLALAKYFYGQKVKDIAAIQRLIYLVFLKILQEKNVLLFTEEWQAWKGGPVVESAFQPMSESQDYANLFTNVPEIENKEVLLYLKEIYHSYQNYKKTKDEYKLFEKARNKPWQLARRNLVDEFDYQKIELGDILSYIKQERDLRL
ncbi:MAG: hypothetical protein MRERV_3c073 [Mycoplasmataceae bacterium RV_VA103A]|nr:MAG: hypothetical protein MRERV_3c073 [Mycoplasmataceae bacterium RV_VA103A]